MTKKTRTHTFSWHEENAKGGGMTGSFLAWAVLTMTPQYGQDGHDELFEQLSEATDRFQKVELGITLSGVPVDAERFMARLDEAMDHAVEREAKKMLIDRVPGLDGIHEALRDLETAVKEKMYRLAAEAGFEITEDDWRDR